MKLPSHVSLVEEISDILNISTDSAYRRLRGEKPISFEELQKLCLKYKISLDQLFHLDSDSFIFSGYTVKKAEFGFLDYWRNAAEEVQKMNSFEKREMFYLNKDIPIFHHFQFPKLAAFKCFFWMRTILNDPLLNNKNFSFELVDPVILQYGKKLVDAYSQLPSTEIWNIESVNSSLRQIEYYREARIFSNPEDVATVYDELLKCLELIELQAELGYKISPDRQVHYKHIPYRIFVNEFVLGDNTILVKLNDTSVTFLVHSVFNHLHTFDKAFNELTYNHFQTIIRKSTLISESGEKDRVRFFTLIRQKINESKNANL
ncbi:helix-turn-helix domain-containing protein [Flavihumibacter profundi]|jgi:hypothetical protein|uniref:helix-turn-helix domain-containing protein n=1 Tax=Flavihumibacter profundi TaxID=2716883 RepID=UPI001CC5DAEA|nr:helix-turn-helix domain-containing protein [Flavihumibacter profundi]MBZ5855901.1 hypothetical protein [Flavihumibacter profundi]